MQNSTIAVPLWRGEAIRGMIICDNRSGEGLFTAHDLDLLLILARHATLAIDNANLFTRLADQTAKLHRQHEQIQGAMERQLMALGKIVATISHEMNSPMGAVQSCVETTLALIDPQCRGKTRVIRQYGKPTSLLCHGRQINQVFMTILKNAFEVTRGEGAVTIATRVEGERVVITIS